MAECSRFPQGVLLTASTAIARPVGTLIYNSATGLFGSSTNAAAAAFSWILGRTVGISATTIADPGTAAAIPVTDSGSIDLTIAAGVAETNTLAIPTNVGQVLVISAGTVGGGGTRAITCAQAINVAGNTIMTFDAASDWIALIGVSVAGALRWRVLQNANVALS